jgi:transcriptional regulator with XRE-family HTH domain
MLCGMHLEVPPTPPESREDAARVIAALAAAGVSQAELARRLGLNQTTVNRWCKGVAPVSRMAWLAMTQALGLPATWEPGQPGPSTPTTTAQ